MGDPAYRLFVPSAPAKGWLVVADSDLTKPWDEKISHEDVVVGEKTIHIVRC